MHVLVERSPLMSLFQTVKYALCEETGGSFRSLVIRPRVVSVPGHFDPIISLSFNNVCSIGFNSKKSCMFTGISTRETSLCIWRLG